MPSPVEDRPMSSWRSSLRNAFGQRTTLSGIPLPEVFYFPACYRSLGQWAWGSALADSAVNNTCVLNATSSPYIFGTCNPDAPGVRGDVPETAENTFMTPDGALAIECGGKSLSLKEAQAVVYETESRSIPTPDVTAVVALIHAWLGF